MTKVVLNDVEYDTEDFTEDQNKVLAELVKNNSVKTNLEYQLYSLNIIADLLLSKLKKSLSEEVEDDN
tara:strand:- start:576 stop:779 length:204 start_codon:yes stop_codon:yes gene_type:complete